MEKINIAEILKNCEKGMELDCILFKDTPAFFHGVITETNYPIEIKVEYPSKELETFFLNKYGAIYDRPTANCVIFPKGKTTWEGFHKPFKDGDIVVTKTSHNFIFYSIYKGVENRKVLTYVDYHFDSNRLMFNDNLSSLCFIDDIVEQRFATEDEKQELFDAIKANGYKCSEETKTLEKLTPNKFDITALKPFDKVLMRSSNAREWVGTFYSHYSNNKFYGCGMCCDQCVPYEENQHLLGTTNDCEEYYKNW